MALFAEWLAKTKDLQQDSFGHTLPKTGEDLIDWIKINTLAAEDELHEALNEVGWKPWASTRHVHREEFIGELVDCLHFIGNLLAGVGCTDQELSAAYEEKMRRNAERQAKGYSGTDKCQDCGRSRDDILQHGGSIDMTYSDGTFICNRCGF